MDWEQGQASIPLPSKEHGLCEWVVLDGADAAVSEQMPGEDSAASARE